MYLSNCYQEVFIKFSPNGLLLRLLVLVLVYVELFKNSLSS